MRTFIICLLFAALSVSCNDAAPTVESNTNATFDVIEVDGCEYLIRMSAHRGYFAHKGNCKYCAERAILNRQ